MKMKIIITAFALIISASLITAQVVGDNAPSFTVNTLDGGTAALDDYSDKVLLLYFFGYGCPYCIASAPDIESDIYQLYMDSTNFAALGIDTWNGNTSQVNGFKSQTGLSFPLAVSGSTVATSFGTTYDRLIVVDQDGIIRHKSNSVVSSDISNAKSVVTSYLTPEAGSPTSIDNNKRFELSVFPNPASDFGTLQFSLTNASSVLINVIDITGQIVKTFPLEHFETGQNSITLDYSNLSSGIYFIHFSADVQKEVLKVFVN